MYPLLKLKRLPVTILLLIALILPVSFAFADSDNLLVNPGFTDLDASGMPVGWYTDAYILDPGYTVFGIAEGDDAHPMEAEIRNIGENDARFAQIVPVKPGSLYCLSGYIRAEEVTGGHGANLSIEGVYAFSRKCFDTDGDWERIEYYGETSPEQEEITVFARLGGYSGMSTGFAAFADLSLTEVSSVPGDLIADLWYKESYAEDDIDTEDGMWDETDGDARNWPVYSLLTLVYVLAAIAVICYERTHRNNLPEGRKAGSVLTLFSLALALAVRLLISARVEGYMVDVNCFLSWGNTMASVGPVRFYETTSFCDYPPLYLYVLGINSGLARLLGGSAGAGRIAFRLFPCLCDLAAGALLYRLASRKTGFSARSCRIFLVFALFNPATILNSAAWGQMDSVLCLLLLAVSVLAIEGRWAFSLPLYVIAVLVKPQALMLGPLGLTYILMTWFRNPSARKLILTGTAAGVGAMILAVLPFSLHQNWDWLLQLYGKTLSSYPYATVNTANLYYLLGGNWSPVDYVPLKMEAPFLASLILSACSAGYGIVWFRRSEGLSLRHLETLLSGCFSVAFLLCGFCRASWAWIGGTAMAFAFLIVISQAVRSGDIRLLPWLGGLLFILLYVFGVKMHERYIFPALLLLAAGWVYLRDRRILYVLLLFTLTLFVNEAIVLDNSIRLGSGLGHLNSDTVGLACVLSLLNLSGALYAVWLSFRLVFPEHEAPRSVNELTPPDGKDFDRRLCWTRKDTLLVSAMTAVYAAVSLLTLGSCKAPQTCWSSSSPEEQIIFDLGEVKKDFEILYFAQVSREDFTFAFSGDGTVWSGEVTAEMDQGQCWKWKYVQGSAGEEGVKDSDGIRRFEGRYVRLTACQLGLKLNEVLFRDAKGDILPVSISGRTGFVSESELYSDPAVLIDEQDTLEPLPSFLSSAPDEAKAQPSWWNSTYFDEIYHARTAYEFTRGTVPYETSHPPLGKVLMSWAVSVFGMTPFGWRFAGALAGILMLPGMYLVGKQLTKRSWAGAMACALMALDCMHLTQTQIATIDSFPVLFIIFSFLFMLRFLQTDFIREKLRVSLYSLGLSGLFMGLAIASKWIGIYAGAGLAVLFFWHCFRISRLHREGFLRRLLTLFAWCVLFFLLIPAGIYLLSYIPYMAYNARNIHSLSDYAAAVWRSQVGMFNYHSTSSLGMDHPFYSPWWEWPVIGKPMYYASEQFIPDDFPVHHSIFCFGNPVIWFSGLAGFAACLFRYVLNWRYPLPGSDLRWHRKPSVSDIPRFFVLAGGLAQYLPWVLVPRGTYIYHYFASIPFLMLSICLLFSDLEDCLGKKWVRVLTGLFLAAAAVFFIILFPYASGLSVSSGWLDLGRGMLRIWY